MEGCTGSIAQSIEVAFGIALSVVAEGQLSRMSEGKGGADLGNDHVELHPSQYMCRRPISTTRGSAGRLVAQREGDVCKLGM